MKTHVQCNISQYPNWEHPWHILASVDKQYKRFNMFWQVFLGWLIPWLTLSGVSAKWIWVHRQLPPPWLIHICIPDISLLDKIIQIRYCRYGSHLFQMIYFLVVPFFFFSHGTDGQKRKKSLRRKLDSLAKEKSKDKGTPSSFDTHFTTFFSPSLPLCVLLSASLCHDSNILLSCLWVAGPDCGPRPSGRWTARL